MTKINRRDYLKGIGATAGAMALGTPSLAFFDSKESSEPGAVRINQNTTPNWIPTTNEPSHCSTVTLIFDGLMGFFYNPATRKFEIGFHPGDAKHEPQIHIWEKPADQCDAGRLCKTVASFSPLLKEVKLVQLEVHKSSPAVKVFQANTFDRVNGHPKDFRWLPDLDGADFYPAGVSKKKMFNIKLEVNDGTFYTRMRSNSTFTRVDSRKKLSEQTGTPFGFLPRAMATAIQLTGDEFVSLTLRDSKNVSLAAINLSPKTGSIFEVDFFNRCDRSNGCADPQPNHDDDEKKRNDFHYMRKVLSLPSGQPKYTVALEHRRQASPLNFCGGVLIPMQHQKDNKDISDEAPCMGAGYGQGGCNC